MAKKLKYRCTTCNSAKVQGKAWVNLNTHEIDFSRDEEDYWCEDCKAHRNVELK